MRDDVRARRPLLLRDLLGDERYERDARELASKGLYLDLPPWGVNAFAVEPHSKVASASRRIPRPRVGSLLAQALVFHSAEPKHFSRV